MAPSLLYPAPMKRAALALLASPFLALPLAACTDADPYDGEVVKDQDGKADTSAAALFVDFEFDGQLLTDSSWNAENTIEDQLLSVSDFRAMLPGVVARKSPKAIYIRADVDSRGGDIVTVLGLVRKTGISSVGIVAEPDGR